MNKLSTALVEEIKKYLRKGNDVVKTKLHAAVFCFRFFFSGHELEVQQIGKTTDESSYMIGRFDTDTDTNISVQLFGQEIRNMHKKETNERRNSKIFNRR